MREGRRGVLIDPDRPVLIGNAEPFFDHPFDVETLVDPEPTEQVGGCLL